jgi:DivIVA domain-containing protein
VLPGGQDPDRAAHSLRTLWRRPGRAAQWWSGLQNIRHLTDVSACKLQQHLLRNCLHNRQQSDQVPGPERALTTAWFDEQPRLTLEELQSARFPLGRRGYDEESVNSFLRLVQAEFVRLVNERASLWQEVQRLRRRILAGEAEGDPLFGEADAHVHAVRIPSATVPYMADAGAFSGRMPEEARQRRERLRLLAGQHSDTILEDAKTMAREAAVSALNLLAPPQTDRERRAAQAELAYLRTYGDFYRAHLRAYTEGMLRGIKEWERNEAASIREAAPGPADHRSIGR